MKKKPSNASGWGDRLKLASATQAKSKSISGADTKKQVSKTAPGDTNRKNRKGYRPG